VQVPAPNIDPLRCKLNLPTEIITGGLLSALQLETIIYASLRHSLFLENGERSGFLLGDGAGIGKGRQIAGLIYENYLRGRTKAMWVSASADLAVRSPRQTRHKATGVVCCFGVIGFGSSAAHSLLVIHPTNKQVYIFAFVLATLNTAAQLISHFRRFLNTPPNV
jgi:hypothetical protein